MDLEDILNKLGILKGGIITEVTESGLPYYSYWDYTSTLDFIRKSLNLAKSLGDFVKEAMFSQMQAHLLNLIAENRKRNENFPASKYYYDAGFSFTISGKILLDNDLDNKIACELLLDKARRAFRKAGEYEMDIQLYSAMMNKHKVKIIKHSLESLGISSKDLELLGLDIEDIVLNKKLIDGMDLEGRSKALTGEYEGVIKPRTISGLSYYIVGLYYLAGLSFDRAGYAAKRLNLYRERTILSEMCSNAYLKSNEFGLTPIESAFESYNILEEIAWAYARTAESYFYLQMGSTQKRLGKVRFFWEKSGEYFKRGGLEPMSNPIYFGLHKVLKR